MEVHVQEIPKQYQHPVQWRIPLCNTHRISGGSLYFKGPYAFTNYEEKYQSKHYIIERRHHDPYDYPDFIPVGKVYIPYADHRWVSIRRLEGLDLDVENPNYVRNFIVANFRKDGDVLWLE